MKKEETGEFIRSIEAALDRTMPDFGVPRPRWFAHRNAAGYTEREVAIANREYRKGAQFVLREINMADLLQRVDTLTGNVEGE